MSMTDPIADLLTRVRNGQTASKVEVSMPSSKVKVEIAKVLKDEGYVGTYAINDVEGKANLVIQLRYYQGKPVIDKIKRVSSKSSIWAESSFIAATISFIFRKISSSPTQ